MDATTFLGQYQLKRAMLWDLHYILSDGAQETCLRVWCFMYVCLLDFIHSSMRSVKPCMAGKLLYHLLAGPCLDKLYVFAYTAGGRFAGSDTAHKIEVRAGGEVHLTELYDRKGDDYKANKGDVWIFSFSDDFNFSKCIRKPDIEGITLKPGGNDGWNVESVITFAYDADGDFHLATRDINIYRTIDGNGSPDQRSIDLTVVHVL